MNSRGKIMFDMRFILIISLVGLSLPSLISVSEKENQRGPKNYVPALVPSHNFPEGLQMLLDDTAVLETGSNHLRAGISYMFADFKYRDGSIKICEFGGCNHVSRGDKYISVDAYGERYNCITPCWNMFWQYVSQLNLPVWDIRKNPNTNKKGKKFSQTEHIAWRQFKAMGGLHATSLKKLEEDPAFIAQARSARFFDPADMSTYRGVIMIRWFGYSRKKLRVLKEFRDKYPEFLIVDEISKSYSARKSSGVQLFNNPELSQYKPRWALYPRQYTPDLAQRIIEDIKSDTVVIKPTNSSQSKGVLVVKKEKLDEVLKKILPPPLRTVGDNHWSKTKNKLFLVEEFCQSKNVTFYGKQYDPTMRMFFILRSDKGRIYATVLGGYWKIPPKSLSEKGTMTQKHKTYAYMGSAYTALPISTSDTHNARALLKKMLPHVYLKMLEDAQHHDPLLFAR